MTTTLPSDWLNELIAALGPLARPITISAEASRPRPYKPALWKFELLLRLGAISSDLAEHALLGLGIAKLETTVREAIMTALIREDRRRTVKLSELIELQDGDYDPQIKMTKVLDHDAIKASELILEQIFAKLFTRSLSLETINARLRAAKQSALNGTSLALDFAMSAIKHHGLSGTYKPVEFVDWVISTLERPRLVRTAINFLVQVDDSNVGGHNARHWQDHIVVPLESGTMTDLGHLAAELPTHMMINVHTVLRSKAEDWKAAHTKVDGCWKVKGDEPARPTKKRDTHFQGATPQGGTTGYTGTIGGVPAHRVIAESSTPEPWSASG